MHEFRELLQMLVWAAAEEDAPATRRIAELCITRTMSIRDVAYSDGLHDAKYLTPHESVQNPPQADQVETVYRRPRKRR